MAFFEAEFPRSIRFQRAGGQTFSTDITIVESGFEQRNRKWRFPRAEYSAAVITSARFAGAEQNFIDALRGFYLLVGGAADGFRFYDDIDHKASAQPLGSTDPAGNPLPFGQFQLQVTYSLGDRSFVRPITKPITSSVIDYLGNPLSNTVVLRDAGGGVIGGMVDHATGIASAIGAVSADFEYHIPVRFLVDKFEPQLLQSAPGHRLISWNSMQLIEVRPPNY